MTTAVSVPQRVDLVPSYHDPRHPLGLPAGSVRATLCLMIVGVIVTLLLQPPDRTVTVPLFLYGLLAMLLLFVVAHGNSIAPARSNLPSPWWLPGGLVRGLILLALAAAVGWQLYYRPHLLPQRLTPTPEQLAGWPHVLAAVAGGFVLGRLFHGLARRAWWFQDILAWVALLDMAALVVEWLLLDIINPSLPVPLNLAPWEGVLTALVTFYFGARC
jgi:hypothetical protein